MNQKPPEALAQECADYATSLRSTINVVKLEGRKPPISFLRAAELFERAAARIAALDALRTCYDAARLEIESLQAQLAAIGAGGVEPLRKRECLHQIEEPSSDALDKIMELTEMYAHAAVTDDCPFDRLPRNVLRRAIAEALAAAPAQAQGDAQDAARYRFLRDGEWRRTDLESVIRLQLSALWDAKIDAAIAAKQGKKP